MRSFSKTHRLRISKALIGRRLSKATKAKMSRAHTGRASPLKGRPLSLKHRKKIKAAIKAIGGSFTGRKHSRKTIETIRAKAIARAVARNKNKPPRPESIVYWCSDATCKVPQKHGYIGVTKQLPQSRENQHRRKGIFPKKFVFTVLFEGSNKDCLDFEKNLRPHDGIGWNKTRGGGVGVPPGYKMSDETVRRMRKAQKGRIITPEHATKISATLTGRVHTLEARAKMIGKKKPKSLEWRKRMSVLAQRRKFSQHFTNIRKMEHSK